jgi:PAS domain S-box-containing protein
MSEVISIPRDELTNLEERVNNLAKIKSYYQLIIDLMNRISSLPGLENTVENLLTSCYDIIGGTNIKLYYTVDNDLFYSDIFIKKVRIETIDDAEVNKVFEDRESIEIECDFNNTQLTTPKFTKAYSWVFPLLVGQDLIGVLKIENVYEGMRELYRQFSIFFNYVALILKNEIIGYTQLKKAYEKLQMEVIERELVQEELLQIKKHFEEIVIQRTYELEKTNEALRQSEEKYRTVADFTYFWETWLNPDGKYIYVSPSCERISGYNAEEFLSDPLLFERIVHPDDKEKIIRHKDLLLKVSQEFRELEFRIIKRNGELCWISHCCQPVFNQDGIFLGRRGSNRDITKRVRGEEEIRMLKHSIDMHYDGAYWIDSDNKFVYVNDAGCKAFGYKHEELIGKTINFVNQKATTERMKEVWEDLRNGKSFFSESVHRRKDGSEFPVEITSTYVHFAGKEYIYGFAHDITERKQTEAIAHARSRILEYSLSHTWSEMLQFILDKAELLTGSSISFFHFLEDDQKMISLQNWSTRTLIELCKAEGKGTHYPVDQAGVWADCIRERHAVIYNDYESLPQRKGMPSGHVAVTRFMAIPIFRSWNIVAIIGTGNKKWDYDDIDVMMVNQLADLSWDIIERKRAEEALRESEQRLSSIYNTVSDVIFHLAIEADGKYRFLSVNQAFYNVTGLNREQVVGKMVHEIIPEPSLTLVLEKYKQGIDKKKIIQWEETSDYPSGRLVGEVSITPVVDDKGLCKYLVGSVHNITERKRAEEALRESEERFHALFERAPLGYQSLNDDGRFIEVNQAWLETLGYTREDVIGKWFGDFLAPEFVDAFRERFLIFKKLGKVHSEFYMIHKNGSRRYITFEGSIGYQPDGSFKQTHCILSDFTERKRAEESLKESEEKYRTLFENMKEGVFYQNMDGSLVDANASALDLFGLTKDQFLGRTSYHTDWKVLNTNGDELPPEKHPSMVALLTGKPVIDYELAVFNSINKKYVWLLVTAVPQFLKGEEKPFQVFVTMRDISERKQYETNLQAREIQFSTALNIAHMGYWEYEVDKDIFTFNEHFYNIFHTNAEQEGGYTKSSAQYSRRFVHPDDQHIVGREIRKVIDTTDPNFSGDLEHRIIYADGNTGHISVRFFVVKDNKGRTIKTFGVNQDITERKLAEEELLKSKNQLRALTSHIETIREEERTRISREIHDELGQSLTGLKIDLSWLQVKTMDKDREGELALKIKTMSDLIDSCIGLVRRISSDLRPGILDHLGLSAAIEWQAKDFQDRTGIKCKCSADFEDVELNQERSVSVFRIFQETLTNIVRHSKASEVRISLQVEENNIILIVKDNGIGISKELINDPNSLGLLGMKERVLFLNGEFEISGIHDKGTTVIIIIPKG